MSNEKKRQREGGIEESIEARIAAGEIPPRPEAYDAQPVTFAPVSLTLTGFDDSVRGENDCEPAEPPTPKRTPRKLRAP